MDAGFSQLQKTQMTSQFVQNLLNANDAIYGVLLSSTDGHAVDSAFKEHLSDSKIAAMASSCLALSERIAQESLQEGCDFVILQNQNGYLAIKRINPLLVCTVIAKDALTLGILLSSTKNAVEMYANQL